MMMIMMMLMVMVMVMMTMMMIIIIIIIENLSSIRATLDTTFRKNNNHRKY